MNPIAKMVLEFQQRMVAVKISNMVRGVAVVAQNSSGVAAGIRPTIQEGSALFFDTRAGRIFVSHFCFSYKTKLNNPHNIHIGKGVCKTKAKPKKCLKTGAFYTTKKKSFLSGFTI